MWPYQQHLGCVLKSGGECDVELLWPVVVVGFSMLLIAQLSLKGV